jgi:hypothetical protein
MSLTSYRTAPPRVTEFPLASDTPGGSLAASGSIPRRVDPETTSRPYPAEWTRSTQPAEPRIRLREGSEIVREAPLIRAAWHLA